jgi:vacuolar-type H+-ATPase subunit I/STV1
MNNNLKSLKIKNLRVSVKENESGTKSVFYRFRTIDENGTIDKYNEYAQVIINNEVKAEKLDVLDRFFYKYDNINEIDEEKRAFIDTLKRKAFLKRFYAAARSIKKGDVKNANN